jgi:hypothetical protein
LTPTTDKLINEEITKTKKLKNAQDREIGKDFNFEGHGVGGDPAKCPFAGKKPIPAEEEGDNEESPKEPEPIKVKPVKTKSKSNRYLSIGLGALAIGTIGMLVYKSLSK